MDSQFTSTKTGETLVTIRLEKFSELLSSKEMYLALITVLLAIGPVIAWFSSKKWQKNNILQHTNRFIIEMPKITVTEELTCEMETRLCFLAHSGRTQFSVNSLSVSASDLEEEREE